MVAGRKSDRTLSWAIGASIALHAALLLGFPDLLDSAREAISPPPLIARLLAPEPEPVPAPPPELKKPPPPPPRLVAKPAPKPKAPVSPPPSQVHEPPAPQPQPLPVPPPPVAQPAPPPPAPPVALAKPQAAPSLPAEAPEKQLREQYRLQLIGEARRHKRYPPLARENNWQGNVLVAVRVGADGRPSVNLKESSGYEVLDRQALDMFGRAARSVPVPPALRGREFALEVRAVYGLED